LFSGDRFIPYRPEEIHLEGAEQYLHEEKLLSQNMLRVPKHHRRNQHDVEMSDSNNSRDSSPNSSNNSSNSSTNSNRSTSERVHRASRRRL